MNITLLDKGMNILLQKKWLKILGWADYPGLSGRPNVITRILIKGKQEGQNKRKDVKAEEQK